MNNLYVIEISEDALTFSNNYKLRSYHDQDCCENHYISFADLTMDHFNGLIFNLSEDNFFERIAGYGIALKPINGHPIRIPGYGSNNGYYSSNLDLVIYNENGKEIKSFDVSDCQDIVDN